MFRQHEGAVAQAEMALATPPTRSSGVEARSCSWLEKRVASLGQLHANDVLQRSDVLTKGRPVTSAGA